jgi:F0F1-type ATP synthase delta subunit
MPCRDVRQQFFDLQAQVKDHFANPVVPEDDKREMLEKLCKDADFSQHTQNFLGLLVQVLPLAIALRKRYPPMQCQVC